MQFIDTHIHLQDFKTRCATSVVKDALFSGVSKLMCVACVEEDWDKILHLYQDFPDVVVPVLGIHPWYASSCKDGWETRLDKILEKHPQILVGECGIDLCKNTETSTQRDVFEKQIALAKKHNRSIVLHLVKAQAEMEKFWSGLPSKFVVHSFNGKTEFLKKIIKQGGYVGFNFSILRNRQKSDILQMMPVDKILLETDGPYQGPVRNQEVFPSDLSALFVEISHMRGEEQNVLAQIIFENSLRFMNVL